ncbi:patatin-like phospholipase family protein [Mucilaginibacter sabulilitoris]|uniref:Patatin-like phospholipase family protein n=1 Tax=Mucilaginibacter sabulilitoris TaxID=1173583 RepID=A0ABZ0TFV6_9SPHI|nr:patatin-like phospholipase family protein [Mucilaginibacter sabulilitoris]WPU92057.1 patatin-like phospholipase family protein [Mucilaginibacter sabulilitoris]
MSIKPKVALVLSGGGARGMAHIGVIEELERQGFQISSLAGTSMGALVGGVHALGKMEVYKNWLYTLDKIKIFRLIDLNFRGQGLVKGDKLLHKMRDLIADRNIEDLPIPYAAVAADIINKKEVVLTTGSVLDAIRASIAIPTIVTPVKTKDGLLVDGGVINSLPIDHVSRLPNDILIVVNVNAPIPKDKRQVTASADKANVPVYRKRIKAIYKQLPKIKALRREEKFGYFDVISKTLSLMTYHNTQLTLEKYTPDILINISRDSCGLYDFYRAEELVETGKRATITALDAYRNKLG